MRSWQPRKPNAPPLSALRSECRRLQQMSAAEGKEGCMNVVAYLPPDAQARNQYRWGTCVRRPIVGCPGRSRARCRGGRSAASRRGPRPDGGTCHGRSRDRPAPRPGGAGAGRACRARAVRLGGVEATGWVTSEATRRPRSTRPGAAGRSCPSRSRVPAAGVPRRCRCAARTGCPGTPAGSDAASVRMAGPPFNLG